MGLCYLVSSGVLYPLRVSQPSDLTVIFKAFFYKYFLLTQQAELSLGEVGLQAGLLGDGHRQGQADILRRPQALPGSRARGAHGRVDPRDDQRRGHRRRRAHQLRGVRAADGHPLIFPIFISPSLFVGELL